MKPLKLHQNFLPAVERLQETLRGIRSGRATAALVESLPVDCYGTTMRLRDIATIMIPEARVIQIEPWDPAAVPAVEKALAASALGVMPVVTGTTLRLVLPPLTEERRRDLVKLVGKYAEDTRIAIRMTREKILRGFKRSHEEKALSDDLLEREKETLQKHVDEALTAVQDAVVLKERELKGP